jgi:[ribosomal protein S5]-alanine N-acetyltransferase
MSVLETQRLLLRHFSLQDGKFVVELFNEPAFLRFIGDKEIRSEDDALRYLEEGPILSYQRHGFGLYAAMLKDTMAPIGMCGLLQREYLPDPDLGFAFLEKYRSQGFAYESARAILNDALGSLRLRRVLAIVDPQNQQSIRLLEKLGMHYENNLSLTEGEPSLACYASREPEPATGHTLREVSAGL